MVEKIALEDEGVKAEIAKLKLPEGTVIISDPWIYGMLPRKTSWTGI
jgi:primary-amine oxidase